MKTQGPQYDPPHRLAADAVDTREQLRPGRPSAAALVAATGEEIAKPHGALGVGGVRLIQHARLAAAIAFDAQEPRGEPASLSSTPHSTKY
jgi:hypothetical protein